MQGLRAKAVQVLTIIAVREKEGAIKKLYGNSANAVCTAVDASCPCSTENKTTRICQSYYTRALAFVKI